MTFVGCVEGGKPYAENPMTKIKLTREIVARRMAEENNGGSFYDNDFYTEEQRDVWRKRAETAIRVIEELYAAEPHDQA